MSNRPPFDIRLYISRVKNDLERDNSMRNMGSYDYTYNLGKIDLCCELLNLLRFYNKENNDGKE